jgi:hypothetical protein
MKKILYFSKMLPIITMLFKMWLKMINLKKEMIKLDAIHELNDELRSELYSMSQPRIFINSMYPTYKDYLSSEQWKQYQKQYSGRIKQCFICCSPTYQFHHFRYKNVGTVKSLNDIIPLCEVCHYKIHKTAKLYKVHLFHAHEFYKTHHHRKRRGGHTYPRCDCCGKLSEYSYKKYEIEMNQVFDLIGKDWICHKCRNNFNLPRKLIHFHGGIHKSLVKRSTLIKLS